MAELVDALVLGTSIVRCGGSSPSMGTIFHDKKKLVTNYDQIEDLLRDLGK